MTWVTIPNGDVDPESPLITSLITALRDNPIAIANGDAGAPQVQTAGIATSAVTAAQIAAGAVGASEIAAGAVDTSELATAAVQRAKIQTSTVTLAGTLPTSTPVDITLSPYCFFPMIHTGNQNATYLTGHSADGASADAPRLGMFTSGSSTSYDVDYRYINV